MKTMEQAWAIMTKQKNNRDSQLNRRGKLVCGNPLISMQEGRGTHILECRKTGKAGKDTDKETSNIVCYSGSINSFEDGQVAKK